MDGCGIPSSFHTRSVVSESALFVARQSIVIRLPLFFTLGYSPGPCSYRFFCTLETKKSLVWYAGDRLGHQLPDLFRPMILVPLKATQADSKHANAKK